MTRPNGYTQKASHNLPGRHGSYEKDLGEIFQRAVSIDNIVLVYLKEVAAHKRYLPIVFRSCRGILSLERRFGLERLVSACACASHARLYRYQDVLGILEKEDDAGFLPSAEDCGTDAGKTKLPRHKNIRGREYFSKTNISNNLKMKTNEKTAPVLAEKGPQRRIPRTYEPHEAPLHGRGLDRNQMERLASLEFVRQAQNLFITGASGTGKRFLGTALGYQACKSGIHTFYANASKLLEALKVAKAKGTIEAELRKIEQCPLLILEDLFLVPLDAKEHPVLLDIIENRHGRKSIVITSHIPVSNWYDAIGEPTVANAVLDRIVHSAHQIELTGESVRKIKAGKNK